MVVYGNVAFISDISEGVGSDLRWFLFFLIQMIEITCGLVSVDYLDLSVWRIIWILCGSLLSRLSFKMQKKPFSVVVYLLDYEIKRNTLLIWKALFLRVIVGRVTHRLGQIRPSVARGKWRDV